jgi:hypothetical protein
MDLGETGFRGVNCHLALGRDWCSVLVNTVMKPLVSIKGGEI